MTTTDAGPGAVRVRTRLSAAERREQVLDAAREVVAEVGFHGMSIEAVARRAGITRPIVYDHFVDLPGLLEALVDREGRRALTQLEAALPAGGGGGDPVDELVGALHAYLEAVRADPVTWRLVLMPPEGAPAILRSRIAEGRATVLGRLASMVRHGWAGLESPDPELTALTLSAVADEAARLVLTDPAGFPVARIAGHARWLLSRLEPPASAGAGG